MKFKNRANMTFEFDISSDETVLSAKTLLSTKVNTTHDNVTLIYKCQILEDSVKIKTYDVPTDKFVSFCFNDENIITCNAGMFDDSYICLCGNFQSRNCKFRPISVNIADFSSGLIYNIKTVNGEIIGNSIRSSPFVNLNTKSYKLMYNNDYIEEKHNYLYYGIKSGDIIKLIYVSVADDHVDSNVFDERNISTWILLGLNTKELCTKVWVNFISDNNEYFTSLEELQFISVTGLVERISQVFDIPPENIKIFQDKDQINVIKESKDLDVILSQKIIKKFLLKEDSNLMETGNNKKLWGYQHSVNVYYIFIPDFDNLVKREIIGQGSFGTVYRCTDIKLNKTFALKKFGFPYNENEGAAAFNMEIDILCSIGNHPRIVNFERKICRDNVLYVLMEYMPLGSLRKYLNNYGPLPEPLISKFSRQILEALEYLHGRKIIHRDIKGDNVLLDVEYNVKLADFGLSKNLLGIGTQNFLMGATKSFVGTFNYMAPEVITGKDYGSQADIWSVGATVVEMLTGKPPYSNMEYFYVIFKLGTEGKIDFECPESTSKELKHFLDLCLISNPSERPTVDKLLKHCFLTET